jgi:formylglycine-generating enzyme required for sulfatase activity
MAPPMESLAAWVEEIDGRAAFALGAGLGAGVVGVGAAVDGLGLGGIGVLGAALGAGIVGWRWGGGEEVLAMPPPREAVAELPAPEPPPPEPPEEPWAAWWGPGAPVRPGEVPAPEVLRAATAPVMVWVGGGTFWMGSADDDPRGYWDERPRHRVTVSPLAVAATAVTVRQWREVMGPGKEGDPELPVTRVTWWDAVRWCNARSVLEGLEPCYELGEDEAVWRRGANGYRLPTEAEWEFLARAGTETAWSFGEEEGLLGEHAWFAGNSGRRAHPVAGRRPNPWGLYDVHGNVWEWCADRHDYGGEPVDPVDGRSVDTAEDGVDNGGFVRWKVPGPRALRGGAFWIEPRFLRSADRSRYEPTNRNENIGFRCVRGAARQLGR